VIEEDQQQTAAAAASQPAAQLAEAPSAPANGTSSASSAPAAVLSTTGSANRTSTLQPAHELKEPVDVGTLTLTQNPDCNSEELRAILLMVGAVVWGWVQMAKLCAFRTWTRT